MKPKYDVALVPGRGVEKDGSLPVQAKARVEKAVELYSQGLASKLLFSGHWSYKATYPYPKPEAQAMADYAEELGVSNKDILIEIKSVDTLTNLLYSKEIIKEHGWSKVCIVSSEDHSARIKYLACKIFGSHYDIKFENCQNELSAAELNKQVEREEKSLAIVKKFLDNYENGDDVGIWKMVKETHPAFSDKPLITKEELMKRMGESQSDYD